MVDETVSELRGDFALQGLDFGALKFDDLAAFDIDQVVVMRFRHFLVARPAIAEIVPLQNIVRFEKPNRAIDRRDTDLRVNFGCPFVHQFDIGMIFRFTKDTGDNPALAGNF